MAYVHVEGIHLELASLTEDSSVCTAILKFHGPACFLQEKFIIIPFVTFSNMEIGGTSLHSWNIEGHGHSARRRNRRPQGHAPSQGIPKQRPRSNSLHESNRYSRNNRRIFLAMLPTFGLCTPQVAVAEQATYDSFAGG